MSLNKMIEADFDNIFDWYKSDLNDLKDQRLLITGGNGMIANYLAKFLSYLNFKYDYGISITLLVRKLPDQQISDVEYIIGDICDYRFEKFPFDYIVHAASLASPVYYGKNPIGTSLPNIQGTINLLRASESSNIKGFIFVSSSEVYGMFGEDKAAIEESEYGIVDPMNLRSCYAESKRMGENLCVSWSLQKRIPTKIIRPFHTYGPGIRKDDGRVYADFIYSVVDKRNIVLNSRGEARRAFCYLSDAIAGMLLVMLKGKVGEAYNLGNPNEEWSIYEAAIKATQVYPELNLQVTINEENVGPGYLKSKVIRNCPSISKIQSLDGCREYLCLKASEKQFST